MKKLALLFLGGLSIPGMVHACLRGNIMDALPRLFFFPFFIFLIVFLVYSIVGKDVRKKRLFMFIIIVGSIMMFTWEVGRPFLEKRAQQLEQQKEEQRVKECHESCEGNDCEKCDSVTFANQLCN